ncbi:unnamed protein product, partial [Timema podura]|nr:unnamed protein product [Timema podura]
AFLNICRHSYNRTSRTLCPDNNYYEPKENSELIVGVSTSSINNVYISLLVQLEKNFTVGFSDEITVHVSPAEPRYFSFKFLNDGRDTVLLRVDSPDDLCMTVSIQNISCPVFDLERNVLFEGYWQSISRRGGITLTVRYELLFVLMYDWECSGSYATLMEFRNKLVTFSVSPSITYQDYIVATIAALVALSLFYLFAIIVGVIYFIRKRNNALEDDLLDDTSVSSPGLSGESRNTVESDRVCCSNSDSSLDETDIDMLQDADSEKDIFRQRERRAMFTESREDRRDKGEGKGGDGAGTLPAIRRTRDNIDSSSGGSSNLARRTTFICFSLGWGYLLEPAAER